MQFFFRYTHIIQEERGRESERRERGGAGTMAEELHVQQMTLWWLLAQTQVQREQKEGKKKCAT